MSITLDHIAFAESDNVIDLCISVVETIASTVGLLDISNLPYFAHRLSDSLTNLNDHIMVSGRIHLQKHSYRTL